MNQQLLIEHYLRIKQYEKAKAALEQALAEEPHHALNHYLLACIYSNQELWDEMEIHLEQAFSSGYTKDSILLLRAKLFTGRGYWHKAEHAYIEALSINPNRVDTYVNYAELLLHLGYYREASKLLETAESIHPQDKNVIRCQQYLQMAKDNKKNLVQHMERYMDVENDQMKIHIQLGLAAYYQNDYYTAKKHLREAFLMNPTSPDLLNVVRLIEYDAHPLIRSMSWTQTMGGLGIVLCYAVLILFVIGHFNWKFGPWLFHAIWIFVFYTMLTRMIVWLHIRLIRKFT